MGITPTPTVIQGRDGGGTIPAPANTILGTGGGLVQGLGSLVGYMIMSGSSGNVNSDGHRVEQQQRPRDVA